MAGDSDPLEDMLFSEVDEKAVSDLVGSLESQLSGQSSSAGKADGNGGAGSADPANHHLGKPPPAPLSTTTLEQQQGQLNKPEMRQEMNSKDASPDKTVTAPSPASATVFGEAPTTSVNVASSGSQSHGASVTAVTASGGSTLASPPHDSISTASSRSPKAAPSTGETSVEKNTPRKRTAAPRRSASARLKSLNGAAITTRRNSNTAVGENVSSPDTTPSNSTRPVTSSINTSTFTLSNASLPVGQAAIALDRGTPTIALHRLPSHIVASIAQNGNGTTVSALAQQGARPGATISSASQEEHSKSTTDTGASNADDCQSKIVMSSQSGSVSSVINSVSSASSAAVTPATTSTAAPTTTTTTTTTTVSPPLIPASTPATCVAGLATTSACGPSQTISVTTTISMVRPTAPSPTAVAATSAQTQPRPGLAVPQRIVAPQLIVRPSQQQATIQLPPGFTIPAGMVLMRTEVGQLVMVPQQAFAQGQAPAQAQNNISLRPAGPTSGVAFRVTTPQSPATSQTTRQCSLTPAKMAPAPSPTSSSPALQTSSSSSSLSSSSCPVLRPKGPVAPAVAVAAPQQTPMVIAPQAPTQSTPQPVQPAPTCVTAPPGASVISQEMQENVKKCKNFLATLIKLASHNSPFPETSKNVKALVQDLLDAKIEPEEFTSRLQTELKSSPQPYLVPFLKKSLPALRLSLLNSQQSLTQPLQQGVKPAAGGTPPAAIVAGPAVRIRHPNSVSTTGALPAGTLGHTAAMTGGTVGGQVRMPMVITQSIRPQGTVGKGAIIQAGRSPMGLPVQISANQKNKLNDPGGGSFRDDDDINDVASMAGVNLNEESARILATNSELVGTQIRSCKDEAFLHPGLLHRRILETAKKFGVTEVSTEAVTFISHATQSRLRTLVEKVSIIAQHRLDSCKDDECYEQSGDVRSQLRFFEQLERMEKQRKDEQEREILLKAAKSRSRQEDPEQARLKQKAKEWQLQEQAEIRQRDANLTALAAIGPRKKRKLDSPGTTPTGAEVPSSAAGSPAGSSSLTSSSRQYARQRITRVNLRDLIFYMEQERETAHSLLLYRALLK
ncbi:transcription initiation factor TFIID subunit 4 isoform X2 [Nothobranchius furzeri]|uniref:transcription initiation factor TFIID subunit 4 isoform X2 n=1 Tax=Nothobranchius furzeri TaxID=105023 RepID=UPI0024040C5A|nr:transcription initiation factor TFIID subunit 4 isoform X2 [Nothobranchius furzeri]